ncbi:hypothetical protein E2C01_077357 [Portunus trituberculatus]|uniref:Uncharacterized protein n=1 Tax=Portunus trituberculatus TaxID=210409 RepID=A0A5B7IPI2_PORTR|nr:hypothetical protein [Portunus trituberculatus]
MQRWDVIVDRIEAYHWDHVAVILTREGCLLLQAGHTSGDPLCHDRLF